MIRATPMTPQPAPSRRRGKPQRSWSGETGTAARRHLPHRDLERPEARTQPGAPSPLPTNRPPQTTDFRRKPPISRSETQTKAEHRPRRGREVVQVYASRPDSAVERPAKWLAGFAAVDADPGETVAVGILIPERVVQHWSDGGWTLET